MLEWQFRDYSVKLHVQVSFQVVAILICVYDLEKV